MNGFATRPVQAGSALVLAAFTLLASDVPGTRAHEPARAASPAAVPPAPENEIPAEGDEASAPDVDSVLEGQVTQRFEIYNPHSREQLQAVKDMGFTQVILDWPNLHAAATELGLDVVLANWWTVATEVKDIERAVALASQVDPQRLAGVSMMDEPERNAPETRFVFYRSLYRDLRAHFDRELRQVRLEISHWGPLASWTEEEYEKFVALYQSADRMRIMPYPDLHEGPLGEVYWQMARSRRIMRRAGRDLPLVVILQAWVLPEQPKLPTIDELRVMSYLAMLGGAETVSFFSYDPELWEKTPGFHPGFQALMRELTEFRQRYGGATVRSRMDADGVLTAEVRPAAGSPLRVVVNSRRESAQGLAGLAVVMSGGAATPDVAVERVAGAESARAACCPPFAGRRPAARLRRVLIERRCCGSSAAGKSTSPRVR